MTLNLSQKQKYVVVVILVLTAFAGGRYSVQSPTIKTSEKIATTTDESTKIDTHTNTVTVRVKSPDGTVKTVRSTNTDVTQVSAEVTKSIAELQQTVTPPKSSTLNISALIGNDFSSGILKPTYGAAFTKEIIGPITIGAFGLTNGLVGVSIGLDF